MKSRDVVTALALVTGDEIPVAEPNSSNNFACAGSKASEATT
jgi:hypothetical protein